MKKLLVSAVLVSLFLFGCSQDANINQPVQQQTQQVQQVSPQKSVIKLPADHKLLTEAQLTIGKRINGEYGGLIMGSKIIPSNNWHFNVMFASLYVPAGAFEGTKYINAIFDNSDASIQFTPSPMDFDKPLSLTFSVSGLDFSGINLDNVDFVYITPQGDYEKIEYSYISKDAATGTLTVFNAKIPHFSRFGFID